MEKVPKYLKKLFWFYKISEFGLNRFEIVFHKLCWILLLEKEKVFKKKGESQAGRTSSARASPTAQHHPRPAPAQPALSLSPTDRWTPPVGESEGKKKGRGCVGSCWAAAEDASGPRLGWFRAGSAGVAFFF